MGFKFVLVVVPGLIEEDPLALVFPGVDRAVLYGSGGIPKVSELFCPFKGGVIFVFVVLISLIKSNGFRFGGVFPIVGPVPSPGPRSGPSPVPRSGPSPVPRSGPSPMSGPMSGPSPGPMSGPSPGPGPSGKPSSNLTLLPG